MVTDSITYLWNREELLFFDDELPLNGGYIAGERPAGEVGEGQSDRAADGLAPSIDHGGLVVEQHFSVLLWVFIILDDIARPGGEASIKRWISKVEILATRLVCVFHTGYQIL
jgi:hypothetical protein